MKDKELKSYLKRKDIVIDGNVATWNLVSSGDILGLYSGTFKFRCYLMPSEKLASGRLYRELLGGNVVIVPKHEQDLAFTLSQLRFRIISGPPFWESSMSADGSVAEIPDESVLDNILGAAIAAEFKFFAQLKVKKEEDIARAKKLIEKRVQENKEEDDEELSDYEPKDNK